MHSQILKTWNDNYGNLLAVCTLLACLGACLAYRFDLRHLLEIGRANLPIRRVMISPRPNQWSRLEISIKGFQSESGECMIAVYSSEETFNKSEEALRLERASIVAGEAVVTLEQLDPGKYAVAAYHDLNANEQLDLNKLGAPTEPHGFSNNARGKSGPPSFQDAAFDLLPPGTRIEIQLK